MSEAIPILLYHSVSRQASPQFRTWSVTPQLFAAQMAFLRDEGYAPLTVTQFADATFAGNGRLPQRPVLITFDDGLADFYTNALPILQQLGFAATLYVTTGFVGATSRWLAAEGEGQRPMMTWEQVVQLPKYNIEIGAHSHIHPQLDTLSSAAARHEIVESKRLLEQHLRQPVRSFAYPHGYHSPAVRRLVQQAGYSSACGVKHAMSAVGDDPFSLARLIVTADTDIPAFARLLRGEGLRVAPQGEQLRTRGWRLVRRSRRLLTRPFAGAAVS